MRINSLSMESLEIPFKHAFSHSSASRSATQTILVKAESMRGIVGCGEGCPREYVTNETVDTARQFFEKIKADVQRFENLDDIREWMSHHQQIIDRNPAAWCAVELALLDLLGKETQQTVESLLALPPLTGQFQYTAVLGASSLSAFQKQLQQYSALGFADFKLKVSGNLEEDKQKVNEIRKMHNNVRLRLDANNLWTKPEQVINHLKALEYSFFAIEEPLQANDYDGLREIVDTLGITAILDESFLAITQFENLATDPEKWIINCRISKMGGLLRSISIADDAKRRSIPLILGAQVGESSILTRCALTVANAYRDNVIAQEGAFGTYLLQHDVIDKPIMFGNKGQLEANTLIKGFGLGVV